MSAGFYALLGIEPTSSAGRLHSAYGQARSRLNKERRARLESGKDVADLDLHQARLREAWEVLSDPMRRRRYDALRGWLASERTASPEEVWDQVGEALVHPAASVAARLLRVTSQLSEIGDLPRPPSGASEDPATLIPHEDDLTVTTPRLSASSTRQQLRVVEGGAQESAAGVIVLHRPPPTLVDSVGGPAGLPPHEVQSLLEDHGVSGAFLRAVRERLGLSLEQVSVRTRISEAYLGALEAEHITALPAKTFVRGYVREVAKVLHLDPDEVVPAYMRRYPQAP